MHKSKKKYSLCIIDASYLLYRCYYGLAPLKTSQGEHTQAIYGFLRTIKKTLEQYCFDKLLVVWDGKKKSFRADFYPEYKAQRQAMPGDLVTQKEAIIEILELLRVCQLTDDGYEADDIITTLVAQYTNEELLVVTADKDLQQLFLLSPSLILLDPFKEKELSKEEAQKKYIFSLDRLVMYFSLIGDASDNIPGVSGVGEKTAARLCEAYGSLDELYSNLEDQSLSLKKKLLDDKDNAYVSQKLFKLEPLNRIYDVSRCDVSLLDWSAAVSLFEKFEFNRFIGELERAGFLKAKALFPAQAGQESNQQDTSHFSQENTPEIKEKKWICEIITTPEELEALIVRITEKGLCAVDTETDGAPVMLVGLIGVSLAYELDKSYYIPLAHEEHFVADVNKTIFSQEDTVQKKDLFDKTSSKELRALFAQLKKLLESRSIKKIFHHAHYDELVFRRTGIICRNIVFDTLLAAHLFKQSDDERINLKALSVRYLQEPMQNFKDVLAKRKHFGQVPIVEAASYAAHDALQTLKLYYYFCERFDREPLLKKLFYEIELPFHEVLLTIQERGILLDPEKLALFSKKIEGERGRCLEKLNAAIDALEDGLAKRINPNAPRQIEYVLFDLLGLPVVKKSATGYRSTDQEVLAKLAKVHPIPSLIMSYREFEKIKNTYCDALPSFINPETKKIHSSFSQTMIITGRIASAEPNLHTIPASGVGLGMRAAFTASPGTFFVSADYSQIELRILAHITRDKALCEAFLTGQDIHTKTASELFSCSLSEVTPEQRQLGKRINFSIIYGLTPYGLSQDLGISMHDAKLYIEHYFKLYPGIREWMDRIVDQAKERGYVETLYGHRRVLPGLQERNKTLFEAARRAAVNTPIQGTQADIIKIAMLKLTELFKREKIVAYIVLHIHDELIIEVAQDAKKDASELIKRCMESLVDWEVPLTVSLRTGQNWLEITK